MKYKVKFSSQFKTDYKSIQHNDKLRSKVDFVITQIAEWKVLDSTFHDHSLKGKYRDCRECHVAPNLVLIYKIVDNDLLLLLARLWSHSDLF